MSSLSFKLRPTFLFSSKGDLVRVKKWLTEEPEPELNKVSTSSSPHKVLVEKNKEDPIGNIHSSSGNPDQTSRSSKIVDLRRLTRQQKDRVNFICDSSFKYLEDDIAYFNVWLFFLSCDFRIFC